MKAKITHLPIDNPSNSCDQTTMSQYEKKERTKTYLLYLLILMLNVISFFDHGAIIARSSIYNTNKHIYNYAFMCALSFIGNIIFSFLSMSVIHTLFRKFYVIFFIVIMTVFVFLMFALNNDLYVHFVAKAIISVAQSVIAIYSMQWCIFFSQERERLDMIDKLQFTPMLGILMGYLIEINVPNVKLSFILEGSFLVIGVIVLFIAPGKRTENKTLSLTDEFLRNSINKIESYSEIKGHFFIMFTVLVMLGIEMFIFGINLFVFYDNEIDGATVKGESVELMILFTFIGFIAPFLGIIFGSVFTFCFSFSKLVVVNLFLYIILIGSVIAGIYIKDQNYFKYSDTLLIKGLIMAVISFFNMSLTPFIYGFISNFLTFKEDRLSMYKAEIFVSNFGIILGVILPIVLSTFFKIELLYIIVFASGIGFLFFILFGFICVCNKISRKLANEIKLFEYQIFLIFGNTFGKFVLFIWDECNGEGLIENKTESFSHKLFEDEEPSHEEKLLEEQKIDTESNRLSKMTFSNQGKKSNNSNSTGRVEGRSTGGDNFFSFTGNEQRAPLTNITDPNDLFEKKQ